MLGPCHDHFSVDATGEASYAYDDIRTGGALVCDKEGVFARGLSSNRAPLRFDSSCERFTFEGQTFHRL